MKFVRVRFAASKTHKGRWHRVVGSLLRPALTGLYRGVGAPQRRSGHGGAGAPSVSPVCDLLWWFSCSGTCMFNAGRTCMFNAGRTCRFNDVMTCMFLG